MPEGISRVLTGFRPTSDLTIGNYLGAIKPSVELQNNPRAELYAFVADMHGLTDGDPREIAPYRHEIVRDCMALGIDPSVSTVYMQSDIEASTVQIANRLAPYMSVSELARTPNLKEKMQEAVRKGEADGDEASKANYALLGYPLLMAADIFGQQASHAAVGEDQGPHLELARTVARRFNGKFGQKVLLEPMMWGFESEAIRVLGLDGKGKMSKTNPNQAILLTDDPELARQKIKKAATAGAGEWNETIASHFAIAEATATPQQRHRLQELKARHLAGRAVMKEFKKLWSTITVRTLKDFQANRAQISEADVRGALTYGADKAEKNALETLNAMKKVMGF